MPPSPPRPPVMVPGSYLGLLTDVVARWQVTPARLLEGSGIRPDDLVTPGFQLPLGAYAALCRRAIALTGEPGLGLHMGLQMKVTCHGPIGLAAMVARNVREALEVTREFMRLQSPVVTLRLETEGDLASLYFDEPDPAQPLTDFGVMFLMAGFSAMGSAVTGQRLTGRADTRIARPAYLDRFAHLLPGEVSFGQACNRLVFPAAYLDIPLVMADAVAARMAREQCKRELSALAGRSGIVEIVREIAHDEVMGFRPVEEVAQALHVTERTLQRQLAAAGTSYKDIVDGLRRARALEMLGQPRHSLQAISDALGYTDVSNFTRAFRRWTGETPAGYRRRRGPG